MSRRRQQIVAPLSMHVFDMLCRIWGHRTVLVELGGAAALTCDEETTNIFQDLASRREQTLMTDQGETGGLILLK